MKTFLKILVGVLLAGGLFTFAFYRTPQERAFSTHLKQAQEQQIEAQLAVAQDYLQGQGTKPDAAQAIAWYEKAAASGSAQAAWQLYELYSRGTHVATDEARAFDYLQLAVQDHWAEAQYELGNFYAQGRQVPAHKGQALFWYMTAAQNASASAQAKVEALATEDPSLFKQVSQFATQLANAEQKNTQAMLDVAQSYRLGSPILQDAPLAAQWYEKAWETSNHTLPAAAMALWSLYSKGEGVGQDENTAADYLAAAAELKDPSAQYQLGEQAYSEDPARMEDAFAWFSNAAAQGHSQAQYMTGFMLLQGQGTAKSVPLAIRFFEQAADQENPSAQYVLGQIYLKGIGVKRSPRKGRAWLNRAAQNGSEPAQALLGI